MRKISFAIGEYYHIYNRGVDKRSIFTDKYDLERFFQSMIEFNSVECIGSIYENSFKSELGNSIPKLVEFVAYCLNPNHYHFILKPLQDKGIEKFMHKLGSGYTNYFNEKYDRSGSLFQGSYKAVHVDSNTQLLHLSVYVNLNNRIDEPTKNVFDLSKSSFNEYVNNTQETSVICSKGIILDQFKSTMAYLRFAEDSWKDILFRKSLEKDISDYLGTKLPSA
ncbi:MAG: transposase [Patescibacteria group bacterium]